MILAKGYRAVSKGGVIDQCAYDTSRVDEKINAAALACDF